MPDCEIREYRASRFFVDFHDLCVFLSLQIIRRSSLEEKILLVAKYRTGHTCSNSWICVSIVVWDGVKAGEADKAYEVISGKLANHGNVTHRECGTNTPANCACQVFECRSDLD